MSDKSSDDAKTVLTAPDPQKLEELIEAFRGTKKGGQFKAFPTRKIHEWKKSLQSHLSAHRKGLYGATENPRPIALLQQRIQEKEAELLRNHNELADLQKTQEAQKELIAKLRKEVSTLEKENEEGLDDFNQVVEERDQQEKKTNELSLLLKEEREKVAQLEDQAGKRKRETGQLEEEVKRLKTESLDLRTRAEELREQLRHAQGQRLFTPEPEDPLADLQRRYKELEDEAGRTLKDYNKAIKAIQNGEARFSLLKEEHQQQLNALREQDQRERGALQYELDAWRELQIEWSCEGPEDFERTLKRYVAQGDLRPWNELLTAPGERPAQTREELVQRARERIDLTPFQNLHPALEKFQKPTPKLFAKALQEALSWELNSLWQYLPHPQEEALITPQAQLTDLLDRVKKAAAQLPDEIEKLRAEARQLAQLLEESQKELQKQGNQGLVKALEVAKGRLKARREHIQFLGELLVNIVHHGRA